VEHGDIQRLLVMAEKPIVSHERLDLRGTREDGIFQSFEFYSPLRDRDMVTWKEGSVAASRALERLVGGWIVIGDGVNVSLVEGTSLSCHGRRRGTAWGLS
jgi:hypothetical protein